MIASHPRDKAGQALAIGDRVVVRTISDGLIGDLPPDDVAAIRAQVGKILPILDFNAAGFAELEFTDPLGVIHTIWIEPVNVEKMPST